MNERLIALLAQQQMFIARAAAVGVRIQSGIYKTRRVEDLAVIASAESDEKPQTVYRDERWLLRDEIATMDRHLKHADDCTEAILSLATGELTTKVHPA